jgi:thioredoxin-related protein
MYKLFLILLLGISSLSADMYWADDYKSGIKQAKKEHKNILVYFSKEDCVKCEEMTWVISFDKNVSNYVDEHFVAIEIDVEFDKRQGFKIYETPTIYFLNSKAKRVGKPMTGTLGPKEFLKKLESIVDSTK